MPAPADVSKREGIGFPWNKGAILNCSYGFFYCLIKLTENLKDRVSFQEKNYFQSELGTSIPRIKCPSCQ